MRYFFYLFSLLFFFANGHRILLFHYANTNSPERTATVTAAIAAIRAAAPTEWTIDDSSDLNSLLTLPSYDGVVYLLTNGEITAQTHRMALQQFINAGGGFSAIHSAVETDTTWPWFTSLVGASVNGSSPKSKENGMDYLYNMYLPFTKRLAG